MKIFVSSTFTDMDAARDILNKQVCPRLTNRARKLYGQEIDMTDFRWGIDTENTDNGQNSENNGSTDNGGNTEGGNTEGGSTLPEEDDADNDNRIPVTDLVP